MIKMVGFILFLSVLMSGCATAPKVHQIDNSRTYQIGYDKVWEDIVSFFATRNIPIKNIAKDSGVIYAETFNIDKSFADCGTPGLAIAGKLHANFNVFVRKLDENETSVSVNSSFSEQRQFQSNITQVDCNSFGILEKNILDSIKR